VRGEGDKGKSAEMCGVGEEAQIGTAEVETSEESLEGSVGIASRVRA